MKSILDYIKVFKNIEMYKDPKLRYASIPDASDPDLEQSEPLRPGETLETWKPNPFLKPHAEGGRAGYNDGNTVLPEPNPLSQEERNQKVFNDYVERFKEYLKGSKMPEWFVKDLIKEKAKELGIELADGGRADGGRIGYYKGKLVTRGPNTGKYKIKFPTNTILSDEYKGTKYGTEIEIENLIKKRDKLAQKNIKLKVGPKKSAELRIQKRDANFKSLVDDIVKSGDLTALKSNIRQRGGKIPNEWVVDFWNPAIKGGKDSKAMKKLSEILGRDPTEILSLHEGRVGKIKEVQKIVDTEKALAAVDPNKKKFLEILNTSDKLDLKTVAKQLKLSQINTNNLINSVYKDIYKNTSLLGKEETNFVRYLPDKKTPLSALLRSMNKIEGVDKIARRTITDLLDKTIGFKAAKKYQNPELYKLFKSRIHEFYKLKDALPEGLILNLDHPLSMKVINQLGTDARLQKINVSPITQELNLGLKAQFDKAYGNALKNNNIKAQRAIEKIAHQIELPMIKVGKEVTDPTKFKFIAEDLKSQILSSLENQNKIAKNIKNIDPNLLKAAGMEKYKFNVPEVSKKDIKSFKDVVNNSKKGGALLTNNILNKSKKFKNVKICKTEFLSGGGGLCGKAFADADPQGYLEKVMKDSRLTKYLQSKEGLTAARSFLDKAAKVGRWANPLTLVGGEAWYSTLAGINEYSKGASLGEAINEGLWFIPGKHSRDLDMLLGPKTKGKAGRNLPVIPNEVRNQFDLLTQLGGLINEEGKLSGQLQMQKWYEADKQNESDRLLHASRFDFPTYKKNIAAQGRTDFFQDMASDINWSKTQITPQIEKRLADVGVKGEDVVQKYQAADPTGQSYSALQDRIKNFIVDKYNRGKGWERADPYSGSVWNAIKRGWQGPQHLLGFQLRDEPGLWEKQKELDYKKLTGQLPDQSITKENIPPELIENFLTKFPEYRYIFEGAEGGIASLMKKKW